jgi:hypothetical protein
MQKQRNQRTNYNLTYRIINSGKSDFSIAAAYGSFKNNSDSWLPNSYTNSSGQQTHFVNYESMALTNIRVKSVNADFAREFGVSTMTTGIKVSHVTADNGLEYFTIDENGRSVDEDRTHDFTYNEKLGAVYADFKTLYKKSTFRLGVRAEYTKASSMLVDLHDIFVKGADSAYLNLFPSASITIPFNKNRSFDLAFQKRIDRPRFRYLNPFEFVVDELNYDKGNQFLKPQITTDVRATMKLNSMLSVAGYYTYQERSILPYRDTLDGNKTFKSPINLSTKTFLGVSTGFIVSVNTWWHSALTLDIFDQRIEGNAGNSYLNFAQKSFTLNTTQTFTLPANWSLQLSGFYNSRYLDAPALIKPQYCIDAGIQKSFKDNAGLVKLSLTDLLHSWEFQLSRQFGGLNYNNTVRWETQQVRIYVSYSFGRGKSFKATTKDTGIDEEQKRSN